MRTLVLGIGNSLLTDNGVGIEIARQLRERLGDRQDVVVEESSGGGLDVAERLIGFERAVLIDALSLPNGQPGTLHAFALGSGPTTWNTLGSHDADVPTSLQVFATLGSRIPERVDVVGVEARELKVFCTSLSPEVQRAVPLAVEKVLSILAPPKAG
ncbi:MAG: hydrogenase maturation protease [Deltaproteobacteria bacterium]|nr:hydrogenase maturation protease [Deltaproteobacteria bacterium]